MMDGSRAAPIYLLNDVAQGPSRKEWFAPGRAQYAGQNLRAQKITVTDELNVHFANESDAPESGPRRNA